MNNLRITPSSIHGTLSIPPSKSHTLRALLFALMAQGTSIINSYLDSPDTDSMISAIELLGANVIKDSHQLIIKGVGKNLLIPKDIIDVGNSGQVLRFIGAIASLIDGYSVFTGDHSIKTHRPLLPLIEAISQLQGIAISLPQTGQAPMIIKGPIQPGRISMCGKDSQPVSAMMIACSFLNGPSTIHVKNPGETPWIDLTLSWLDRMGIKYKKHSYELYEIHGNSSIHGFHTTIPGDFSTAAFPIAAALITKNALKLTGLDRHDCQGDKRLIDLLQTLGANIEWLNDHTLQVHRVDSFRGGKIDLNQCIDALPIFSVIGCFAQSPLTLYNAEIARKKESDRIHAIATELKKMGANIIGGCCEITPSHIKKLKTLM